MILKITTRNIWNSTYTLTFLPKSMKSVKACFYRSVEYTEPVFESFVSASLYSDKGVCIKCFSKFELSSLRYSINVLDIIFDQNKRFTSPES